MKMSGEQHIAAPRQRVWEALNDADTLRTSIPGCQSLDKESDTQFDATVEVKVGPIGARFKGSVSMEDLDPPNGYTLSLQGNGGISGSVKGSANVRLRDAPGGTLIVYDVEAQVGGRMAQLGGPIIDATARQIAGKFFARFGERVGGTKAPQPAAAKSQKPVVSTVNGAASPPVRSPAITVAWLLALAVAALSGFLIGRSESSAGSDWAGLAIGLIVIVIVVAGAAFEYGKRSRSLVVTLDSATLRRLLDGAAE